MEIANESATLDNQKKAPLSGLGVDQILALAPDEASKKAGKDLANPNKWVTKAIGDKALWGECQGSGSKPYQTQVDSTNIAFKCSCPSRKFPCKHGLGLLLLYARQPTIFATTNDMPAWVTEWISKRAVKEETKAEKADKPVDEEAQAKRLQARHKKVADGIEELVLWLKDIIRNGILQMPEKNSSFFEGMAKRLVDAQAGGLAGMVRSLGETNFYTEGWQSTFLDQLLRIYMLARGYKNSAGLPDLLQQDIRGMIGFTQSQEELKEQEGTTDTWLVLGKQTTDDDNITTERYWLCGHASGQQALVLNFIVRGQSNRLVLTLGMVLQAELVFYPSVAPLRAIIKRQMPADKAVSFTAQKTWQQIAETETALNECLPLTGDRAFIIENIQPVFYNNQWWLQDAEQRISAIRMPFTSIWKLLSLGGGQPLNMAIVGKEKSYLPLGVWQGNEYKIL